MSQGLFDALKQYVQDALPGGALNREIPTRGEALSLAKQGEALAEASGLPGSHNGPQDALRHSLSAALLAQRYGSVPARVMGAFYEALSPANYTSKANGQEALMDLHSNAYGANFGEANRQMSPAEVARALQTFGVNQAQTRVPGFFEPARGMTVLPKDRWQN